MPPHERALAVPGSTAAVAIDPRPKRARAASLALFALLASLLASALFSGCATTARSELSAQWYELGNAWLDKGDWKRAGQAYSHALLLEPGLSAASFNMARALAEAGDYRAALRMLDKLALADPKNVRILSARAYVFYKEGDAGAALKAYDAVIALDPYAPDAVYNAALLRFAAGRAAQAAADLRRLLAYKEDDAKSLELLGRIEESLGDDAAAVDAYEKVKLLGKADVYSLEHLGLLYEKGGRFADAMAVLEAATKADPARAGAWFALARLRLTVADDGQGGLDALKRALDAGFSDKKAADALMGEPVVAEREKVEAMLKGKGLLP
ncbi:MAG: tetratricopeptide repeat protein [Rectinemataceae bacterium]